MSNEMSPSWLLPVLRCVLAILAWAAAMILFYLLTGRIRSLSSRFANKEDVASELARVRDELRETRAALRELKETHVIQEERASQASAVNMTSQGQVLRLHRRGESVAAISSALRLPAGEVNLIVKVYEMYQGRDREGAVSALNVTHAPKTFPSVEKPDTAL